MNPSEDTADPEDFQRSQPPPVDFRFLIASFVGQAMSSMGKIPNPLTGKIEINLPWARYFIDVLGLLEEKTKGNLDAAEASDLAAQLNMLRLTYVDTQKTEAGEGDE